MTDPNALAAKAWEDAFNAAMGDVVAGFSDERATAAIAAVYAPRIAELEEEVERLREAPQIPQDIVEQVLSMGRVEWGATEEKTSQHHVADFENTLRLTREHFNYEDRPVAMQGVYLAGTETVLCHTGTSPNSGQNARVIVGIWNQLYDLCTALGASHDA